MAKRHRRALEDFEDLYENAPCGYLSLKPDGRIAKVNATFSRWMGWAPGELIGKRFSELLNMAGRIFYETHFAPLIRMQGFFNEVALDLVTQAGQKPAGSGQCRRAARRRRRPPIHAAHRIQCNGSPSL